MDVIVSHVNADFDSLGGLVGGRCLYPGATLVLPSGCTRSVSAFLTLHRDLLHVSSAVDVDPEVITRVVVVDTSVRRRLGPAAAWLDLPGVEIHHYDHHVESAPDFDAAVRRVEPWGCVSSILVQQIRDRGLQVTPVEATAMLLGIYEDTGSLSFAGTRPEDLEAAAWLLRQGADLDVAAQFLQRSLTDAQRRLLHELQENIEIISVRGTTIALAVSNPGPYVEDAASLATRIIEAEGVDAALLLAPMQDELYVIGRSRSDLVNIGATLAEVGGGGHPRAASAVLRGVDVGETRTQLVQALERHTLPEPVARDMMSYPVRTIAPDADVAEAGRRMVRYGHSGLVVVDERGVVGILTRRDVDKARHHRLEHAPVSGFMTRHVQMVGPETPLAELTRIMLEEGIGRLPVVRDGELLGIITRTDVLTALHGPRYLEGAAPRESSEASVGLLAARRLPASVQRLLRQIGELAARQEWEVYAVGGFVRDLFLGVRNLDVDLLVEGDGVALARAVARETGGACKAEGRFGTAKVILPDGFQVDFATARTESYAYPGALPEVEPSSVADDLRRRDFTINAMAMSLRPEAFGRLLDPYGGKMDLERRKVRVLHNLSFVEDPTRLFRAVRFAERYHFQMDSHTEDLAREAVSMRMLERISPERLRAELRRICREPRPVGGLQRLDALGVLCWFHPCLRLDLALLQRVPGALDWWRERAGGTANGFLVFMAALMHPLPVTEAVAAAEKRLRLSPADLKLIADAVVMLQDPEAVLPVSTEPAAVASTFGRHAPEVLLLLRARLTMGNGHLTRFRSLLERYVMEWRHVRLEITGDDLRNLGYRPSPALGQALARTLDARLNGEVRGREQELTYAKALLDAGPGTTRSPRGEQPAAKLEEPGAK